MRCSQCSKDAEIGRKMCAHCAELARDRNKKCYSLWTDESRQKKKDRQKRYALKIKATNLCIQCGKENDRYPKIICTTCSRHGIETLNIRKSANPEKINQSIKDNGKRYYLKHKDTINDKSRIANSKRRAVEGNLSLGDWDSIVDKYEYKCLWCGRSDVKMTIDHVIPISKGGTNYIENIQPLCKSCNSKKNAKTLDFRPFGSSIMDWT